MFLLLRSLDLCQAASHKEGSPEAAIRMTDKLTKLLLGKIKEVIAELNKFLQTHSLPQAKIVHSLF